MAENQWKNATRNNPNIIVTLLPRCFRAYQVWADPHNNPFYIPPRPQTQNGRSQQMNSSQGEVANDADVSQPSEPALQITFDKKPNNPALGYILGSDRNLCDIYFGSANDGIDHQMFTITLNQYNQVVMTTLTNANLMVRYDKQLEERKNFTWIFPAEQDSIHVYATPAIEFLVLVPRHDTDKAVYEQNCQNLLSLASSARRTSKRLKPSSQPVTGLQSGATSSHVSTEESVYLRTEKIGSGGFAKVHKAISMPDGRIVAVKRFRSTNTWAWALEAEVLQKISQIPHDNIVQFIDYRLEKKPYLVFGLAPGGNVFEQNQIAPFTLHEDVLLFRHMLEALEFLHRQNITHRDLKPENILCDSRQHFRLADFGFAKEGDLLMSNKGTKTWMAPEMFVPQPYTAAVDIFGLGLIIAWLLTQDFPRKHIVDEGPSWCQALITHFEKYDEQRRRIGNREHEEVSLITIVKDHMLKMDPKERKSASGLLERADFLWWSLRNYSNNSNTKPQDIGLREEHQALQENGRESDAKAVLDKEDNEGSGDENSTEEVDPETETEAEGPNSEEWEALERELAPNDNNGQSVPQQFIDGTFNEDPENLPGQSGTESSEGESPAVPSGVLNSSQKRKWSPQ